ncbi:ABC transporter substrate-binding protein [Erysipelothrix tonsillarum]|uniref:ABC transporter substrate-binding protein n=1 Tax=Erysipelothrix tonsillarum TaxID=38402 RepID=UPI00036F3655|nr:ABC transporter substrate-binding protein [Erysipelothrix tonsillarum]
MKKNIMGMLVFGLILTGCGSKTSKPIRIVLDWTPNTNHTGLYVAQEKGFFKAQGLEVEIVQPPEGSTTALIGAGGAEFGVSFQDTMAPALASDHPLPVTAVAALIQHNTSGIVSLKEKGIDAPRKLAGHTYATWDSPIEQAIIHKIVTDDGGDYDAINMVPNTVTDVVSALQTNLDAVWIFKGWDGIAIEQAGLETNFLNFADYGSELDYYSPVLIANNDYLETHGDEARSVLKAIQEGYEYAIDKPDEAAEILVRNVPELDLELMKASQQYLAHEYKAEVAQWGRIDSVRWNKFYTWLYEHELIAMPIGEDVGFTNDYLN